MAYFPASSVGKTFLVQSTQTNLRKTGLGISDAADAIMDDSDNSAILTTLGFSSVGIDLIDSADAAAARSVIGSGVGFTVETKNASFTAADAKLYEMDSSGGAIVATLPACSVGARIGFKLKTAGNNVTVTRAGSDTIDGATTYVMSVPGEQIVLDANAAGNGWLIG